MENVTQGDENENNALQNATDAFWELKTDGEFDEFFKTVINELPEEQLTLISSLIGTRVNDAVRKAASNLKRNTNRLIISAVIIHTNLLSIATQTLYLI